MGIKNLFPYLRENAEGALSEKQVKQYLGCTLALDASTHLYQFLAAIRTGSGAWNLTNESGEATSHIQGFANRTIRLLEAGVRPIYVFDGPSPRLKAATLRDRAAKKRAAEEAVAAARADETAAQSEVYKAASAATRVTAKHNADAKRLLRLMGCPVVESPGEAEASCARLVEAGEAYAVATEDMDALAFGAKVMVKNLFDTEGARAGTSKPAVEIRLAAVLAELGAKKPRVFKDMSSFVDFCILSGCDYLDHLPGVGPATAVRILDQHAGRLDDAVWPADVAPGSKKTATTSAGKLVVPRDWDYQAARALFASPDVVDPAALDLGLKDPDYDALRAFLVADHAFNEDRVDKLLARLRKARAAKPQRRIDAFFAPPASSPLAQSRRAEPHPAAPGPDPPPAPTTPAPAPAPTSPDPPPVPSPPIAAPPTPKRKSPATPKPASSKSAPKKAKLAPPGARITAFFSPKPAASDGL